MPKLLCAFSAGEFLDEAEGYGDLDGLEYWFEYNELSAHPYELWGLF